MNVRVVHVSQHKLQHDLVQMIVTAESVLSLLFPFPSPSRSVLARSRHFGEQVYFLSVFSICFQHLEKCWVSLDKSLFSSLELHRSFSA